MLIIWKTKLIKSRYNTCFKCDVFGFTVLSIHINSKIDVHYKVKEKRTMPERTK